MRNVGAKYNTAKLRVRQSSNSQGMNTHLVTMELKSEAFLYDVSATCAPAEAGERAELKIKAGLEPAALGLWSLALLSR